LAFELTYYFVYNVSMPLSQSPIASSSPSSPAVFAVIPHYQHRQQLDRCISALSASTFPITPWVYDNNPSNIGFTRAINLGLKVSFAQGAHYALLLNQDCYVRPDAVANLVKFMEAHPRCGLAGIKQVSSTDQDYITHAGCAEAFPVGMHHVGRKSNGDHTISRPMPWVNGAAVFARMSAVLEFGLMDENMVMIGSDSDWCYTARTRGWEVWYCADAEAIHEGGVTKKELSPEMQAVFNNDMTWWRNKWMGTALFNRLCQSIPYQAPVAPQSTPAPAVAAPQ
jgi:GT2 family glycosyltransferase